MPTFTDRLQHAWNAFRNNRDPTNYYEYGVGSSIRQDRTWLRYTTERSLVSAIYNRIAIDVAQCDIRHVRVNENGRYKEPIEDDLDYIFTDRANIDQTGRAFVQDIAMSLCDEGVCAVVCTDAVYDITKGGKREILAMRTGKVVEWFPQHVRINLYNEQTGRREDVTLPKSSVAIIENPLYAVMNEPNGTLKRLVRKMALLDMTDEANSSGKLDLIIQLPYVIKSEARRKQAELRRQDIENQLSGSKYGIAYTDGTERITQLNRAVENNLYTQVESLSSTLYSQLGLTENVLNGTADEAEMLNYYNRTVEPFCSAIVEAISTTFLTKTARRQKQRVIYIRDPFKLVPVSQIADIADKFTRNEILSSNELRGIIGYRPVDDERADELRNKNLNQEADAEMAPIATDDTVEE